MLQWTRIQLPLSGPLDQATDAKIIDPTQRVSLLVNACYNKDGAISKAHGYEWISYTTPQYSAGVRAGEALTHSMVSDGRRLYIGALHNVDPATGPDYLAQDYFQAMCLGSNGVLAGVGNWSPVVVSQQETARLTYLGGAYINICSVVSAGGFLWSAWVDDGTVYYQVCDETTGVVIKTKTAIWKPGGQNCNDLRIVAMGPYVYIFNDYFNAGYLISTVLVAANPATAADTATVTTTKDPNIGWDACYYYSVPAGVSAVLVWVDGINARLYFAGFTTSSAPATSGSDAAVSVFDAPIACSYHYDIVSAKYLIGVSYQHMVGAAANDILVRTYTGAFVLDATGSAMAIADIGGTVTRMGLGTSFIQSGSALDVWLEVMRDDSTAAVKSSIDMSVHCTNLDSVLEAHTGGDAGNLVSVALLGDSPPAGGVTINRAGTSFIIHFEAGTSTRANVEAAIAALAGADDKIDVKTPGVAAGVLTVAADALSMTMLYGGMNSRPLYTYRVRPLRVIRSAGPIIVSIFNGLAWENFKLSSKPVLINQRTHAWLHYDSAEWPYQVLATTGEIVSQKWERFTVAVALQGRSVGRDYYSIASAWTNDGISMWSASTVTNDDKTKSIVAVKADFGKTGLRGASVGGLTMVGGSQLMALDGRCRPHAFANHPEVARNYITYGEEAGGHLTEGSVYKYLVVYEGTDANGLIHRSAPSLPLEVTIPLVAQLSSLGMLINAGNQFIDYCELSMGLSGQMTMSPLGNVTVTLTPGVFTTHRAMLTSINADLLTAAAPFRILGGETVTFSGIDYVPHFTDRYEIVITSGSAFQILWLTGTHGPAGTNDSAADLLGFVKTRDVFIACAPVSSGAVYEYRYQESDYPFILRAPTDVALVRLDVRTLIAGDEHRNLEDVRICVFRTLADGDEYHQLPLTYQNDTSAAWISITDQSLDSSIEENRQPYTTGEPNDVLENAHPVGHILWAHGDRIWVVDDENPRRVWYSKPVAVGIAPEFCWELQIVMPEPIVLGLSIGTYALLFSETRCWAIGGDGPNALGVGDWLAPRLLSSDNGAVDYRSGCEIEGGAIVYGKRGIYSIQGGAVQPIGREVQDLLEGADVRAIINRRDDRQVWVCCEPAGGGSGYVVVYDYERGRWSKWFWGDTIAATEHAGLVCFGKQDLLGREDTDGYMLGAAEETMQVATGWLKLGGLAGYQRVRRVHLIGTWIGSCTAVVEVFADYSDTAIQTVTLPLLTKPSPDMLCRFVPKIQKCAAIKFQVTVTSTVGAAEKRGIDLHAIELEIGTKGSFKRAQVSK